MATRHTSPFYERQGADGAAACPPGIDAREPRPAEPSRLDGDDPVAQLADLVSELSAAHGGVLALLELLIAGVEDLQRAHETQAAELEELHARVDEFVVKRASRHRDGGSDGHRALRGEAAQARRQAEEIRTRVVSHSGKASELLRASRGILDAAQARPARDGTSSPDGVA